MVYVFYFVLPYELDVVWLFFTFILVELRNKWIFAFWIIICPFSTQKCQCSALNIASVLGKKKVDSGIFIVLNIWMFQLCVLYKVLCVAVICHYLVLFMMYLDFLSEDITLDKSCNVHGFSEMFLLDEFLMAVSSKCLVASSQRQWLLFTGCIAIIAIGLWLLLQHSPVHLTSIL